VVILPLSTFLLKRIGNINFIFSFERTFETIYIKIFYRFFISCLVLEIFSLAVMRCPPSWINFLSH
jgi:hypothetical protein